MKKLIVLLLFVAAGWFYFHEPRATWRGLPAAADPVQLEGKLPPAFTQGDYQITPLARYSLSAVVLARGRYRNDAGAKLAPVDLALGWGPMSAAGVINDLAISQSGRFYEYRWKDEPPLDPTQIAVHSANTHCLPADDTVRRELLKVKRHELVTMEGYLVQVDGPGGYRWRSSLSRTDTRGGACEVFWVTKVAHRQL